MPTKEGAVEEGAEARVGDVVHHDVHGLHPVRRARERLRDGDDLPVRELHVRELDALARLFEIFLQNFVLIQPRTSLPKICKILQHVCEICKL